MAQPKAWLSWSTGKDSAWALHQVREQGEIEVAALLTTLTTTYGRVSMHAVRESLLDAQAEAVGLPLIKVPIPAQCSNEVYEQAMAEAMEQARAQGVTRVVFGDLFLEDVRRYREEKLAACGMTALFPLWGLDTRALATELVAAGLQAPAGAHLRLEHDRAARLAGDALRLLRRRRDATLGGRDALLREQLLSLELVEAHG